MRKPRHRTGFFLFTLACASVAVGIAAHLWANSPVIVTEAPPHASLELPPSPLLATLAAIEPVELPLAPPIPTVQYSALTLEESDTLAITIREPAATGTAEGVFASRAIHFARLSDGRRIALIGIDVGMNAGTYPLSLTLPDGTATTTAVTVRARAFPVTVLATTPELRAQGHTPPAIATNVANENAVLATAMRGSPAEAYFSGSFTNPLDRMVDVGAYGNTRKSEGISLRHLGIDLEAETGTPVHAINDGVVRLATKLTDYGNTISLDHGLGIYSLYLHMDKLLVASGARVKRGTVIGLVGSTGYALAPHLHFSLRIGPASVDPLRFLTAAAQAFAN